MGEKGKYSCESAADNSADFNGFKNHRSKINAFSEAVAVSGIQSASMWSAKLFNSSAMPIIFADCSGVMHKSMDQPVNISERQIMSPYDKS